MNILPNKAGKRRDSPKTQRELGLLVRKRLSFIRAWRARYAGAPLGNGPYHAFWDSHP